MIALPRLRFAHLPTPVEALPNLSAALKGPHLFVKRDDQTGLAFGGNKTRKLEFLMAEAQANGAKMVISAGAAQSNHCRQVAAAAAHFGMACTLVLVGSPAEAETGNLFLDRLLGAEIVWTERSQRDQTLKAVFDAAWGEGKRPYNIPYGGSNPTGAAGYVAALKELMDQDVHPDWIVFPSSSGGTHAGLAVGARLYGFAGKILGISVDEEKAVFCDRLAELASQTAELLGEKMLFRADDFLLNADYLGGGYGVLGETEKEAVRLFARCEGLLLDPVYTGRAAGGLIDLIRQGFFKPDDSVLFWHTGGAPALFAEKYHALLD